MDGEHELFQCVPHGYDTIQVDAYLCQLVERHKNEIDALTAELTACRQQGKRAQTLMVAAEALRDEAIRESDALRAAAERDAQEARQRSEQDARAIAEQLAERGAAFDARMRAAVARLDDIGRAHAGQALDQYVAELRRALVDLGLAGPPDIASKSR